jgi:tetratricopeptide (TPR) repeat protein
MAVLSIQVWTNSGIGTFQGTFREPAFTVTINHINKRKKGPPVMSWKSLILLPALTVFFSPLYAENSYQEMNKLYEAKSYEDLAKRCKADLKKDPRSLQDLYFLALARLGQGKMDKAVPVMRAFEKLHDEREAELTRQQGKTFILIDSLYVDLYYVLGQYHVRQGEYDKAFPWLYKAKSRYIDDPYLHFFLGRCFAGQGKWEEARKSFQKEWELNAQDPSPLYNVACAYAGEGKEKKALDWLQKAIQAHPEYKEEALKDESFKKMRDAKGFKDLTAP